jgi:diphthine synthase
MLFLVGIGLDDKDISLKAIEVCRISELFVDRYTSTVSKERIEMIEGLVGKRIAELSRRDMEENAKVLVSKACSDNIAVLVGGDPLMATTHKILFIEARKRRMGVTIVHSSSVLSAAMGESGLDFYRFGQVATIPKWSEHYKPVSFYETLRRNRMNGMHSLLLLDYKQELGSSMSIKEAIEILERAEMDYKSGIIKNDTKIVVLNNLSSEKADRVFTSVARARKLDMSGMSVIIVPAEMLDIEKEAVACMCRVLE